MEAVDEERPLLKSLSGNDYYHAVSSATLTEESAVEDPNRVLSPNDDDDNRGRFVSVTSGHALLLVVAVLHGSLNVTLRALYHYQRRPDPPTASGLSALRGWLATVCFVPFLSVSSCSQGHRHRQQGQQVREDDADDDDDDNTTVKPPPRIETLVTTAAELAVWNFGARALTNVGLLYVGSARAAVLTQSTVVLTALLSSSSSSTALGGITRGVPVTALWWACGLTASGLILLWWQNGNGDAQQQQPANDHDDDASQANTTAHGLTWSAGDLFCLLGALSWSTYLYRLSVVGDRFSEVTLQACKTIFLAVLYSVWCVVAYYYSPSATAPWDGWNQTGHGGAVVAWMILLYSAAVPGVVADLLQHKGQTTVSATVAHVVLSSEPVFTALLAWVLLGEETTVTEKWGGACVLTAAALVATTAS